MDRRTYIKNACTLCIGGGMLGLIQSLEGCSAIDLYKTQAINNRVNLPLSLFNDVKFRLIRVKSEEFDIGVIKLENNAFTAFQLRCTHANNGLVFTGKNFICNLHGSVFSLNGQVTKGPAEKNLEAFITEVSNEELLIYI